MRLLLTGASGLLGGRLLQLLDGRFEVVAGRHLSSVRGASVALDLADSRSLGAALDEARPDALVSSAALADADACEREPERAFALNRDAPASLARLCRRRGVRLVHLSTDLVLPGDRAFHDERTTLPGPSLVYARSKLEGESAVLAEWPQAAVLRVALVAGRGHGARATASESLRWSLDAGRRVRLFHDQWRTPIDPESVAELLARLLSAEATGIFHAGGPERLSRLELGQRVARAFGLDPGLIDAASAASAQAAAPRPADASLGCERARRELGWTARPLDAVIAESREAPEA
ncbi:MAG: NAD(P)-dependent oxidoreductase [Vicinamibacteria bacterium]